MILDSKFAFLFICIAQLAFGPLTDRFGRRAPLLIGLVVGFIARAVKPGDDKLGWIMTAILGVAGSFLANYVGQALGWYQAGETAGFLAAVVGAVVLLVIYSLVKGKSS